MARVYHALVIVFLVTVIPRAAVAQYSTITNVPPATGVTRAHADELVNLLTGGGIISINSFPVDTGGALSVAGGLLLGDVSAAAGSKVWLSSGTVGRVVLNGTAEIHMSGGNMSDRFTAPSTSIVDMSGGTAGDSFAVRSGAHATFSGYDFRIDGTPVGGFNGVGSSVPINIATGQLFTGIFQDGTPFAFTSNDSDSFANGTLTLQLSDEALAGPTTINLPGSSFLPIGIRSGQTLQLSGWSLGSNFEAGSGSTLIVNSGTVGQNLELIGATATVNGGTVSPIVDLFPSSTMTVNGGKVGAFNNDPGTSVDIYGGSVLRVNSGDIGSRVHARTGSRVEINGGTVGSSFTADSGSVAVIAGGQVGNSFRARSGSSISVSGGALGSTTTIEAGATVAVTGGDLGSLFKASAGSTVQISGGRLGSSFRSEPGSNTTLAGYDFKLNGVPVSGLVNVGDSTPIVPGSGYLSGILADGTPFMLSYDNGDLVTTGSALTLQLSAPVTAMATTFNVPSDSVPKGLLARQTLNLDAGGIVPAHYNVHSGSTIHIHGGTVGTDLEAYQANVLVDGGTLGGISEAYDGTNFVIDGGTIGSVIASSGSSVTINGGTFYDPTNFNGIQAGAGSHVVINGARYRLGCGSMGKILRLTAAKSLPRRCRPAR